jgi:hypothetical protein
MQAHEAITLQKFWGDKPCDHPELEKECDRGAATGDYVCKRYGQSGWGSQWNRTKTTSTPPTSDE